jgi:hypothetical protein
MSKRWYAGIILPEDLGSCRLISHYMPYYTIKHPIPTSIWSDWIAGVTNCDGSP